MHVFAAAAAADAADGASIQIVAANREAAVVRVGARVVSYIDRFPTCFRVDPPVDPRMAGDVSVVARVKIAADISRGDAGAAAAGDENMSVILADTFAASEGLGRRLMNFR